MGPEGVEGLGELSIEVVDLLGRQVAVVSKNEFFQKGKQQIKVEERG